jgi:RyR domain
VCRLLLRDPELRRLLAGHAVFDRGARPHSTPASVPNYRVNFRDLDLQEIAARQVLRQFPLDFQPIHQDDETTVHLVIVGFGPMGQDLALHAGRIGHFANGVPKDRRIRITVVDGDAKTKVDEFRTRHPKVDKVYDFLVPEADPTAPTFLTTLDDLSRESRERKELLTYAICFEKESMANDRENLQIGIDLSRLTKDRPVQTLIYQSTRCGFAALFPAEAGGPALNTRLHAFGMIEEIYSWDVLLHESEDQVARAVHEVYAEYRRREKVIVDTWDVLPDGFKESNRHAADHIPVKLRALGYHDAPLQPGRSRIEDFSDEDVHLLAQMEHRRWCAERWLAGWEHGPETIRAKKISKDLVEWGDLTPEEQKKDYEQIHAIPEVLHGVGRGIYR